MIGFFIKHKKRDIEWKQFVTKCSSLWQMIINLVIYNNSQYHIVNYFKAIQNNSVLQSADYSAHWANILLPVLSWFFFFSNKISGNKYNMWCSIGCYCKCISYVHGYYRDQVTKHPSFLANPILPYRTLPTWTVYITFPFLIQLQYCIFSADGNILWFLHRLQFYLIQYLSFCHENNNNNNNCNNNNNTIIIIIIDLLLTVFTITAVLVTVARNSYSFYSAWGLSNHSKVDLYLILMGPSLDPTNQVCSR